MDLKKFISQVSVSPLLHNHLMCDTDGTSSDLVIQGVDPLRRRRDKSGTRRKVFEKILYNLLCAQRTLLTPSSISEYINARRELKGVCL
jgi:hypothetical protein